MASAFAMSVNGAVSLCMGERREDDDGFHCVVVVLALMREGLQVKFL